MNTKRDQLALDTLKTGGYFRKALEAGFQGREQFETRLRSKDGKVVKGVGFKTWMKFEDSGMLKLRPCHSGSTWPTEWSLA